MTTRRPQRGVALIMAILMVALATILAVSVASDGYMDQRRTSTVIALDQAYEFGLGGEALAAFALQADDNVTVDSPDERWATPINYPLPDQDGDVIGDIKGNLEDLQGRFNINKVLNPDGTPNDSGVHQFQRLLELLGIDTKYATLFLDWVDANTNPSSPDGAEDAVYAGQSPAYQPPNVPVTRTSELMSLVGMKYEDYLKLEPFIAALPLDSQLNVCTASAEVLDAISEVGKREYTTNSVTFAKNRAGGCFPNPNNIKTSFSTDKDYLKLMQDHPDYLSETSKYFRANILVTIGTTEFALYSVLHRPSTGPNSRMRVIQRSFGTT